MHCQGTAADHLPFISKAAFGVGFQKEKKKGLEGKGCRGLAGGAGHLLVLLESLMSGLERLGLVLVWLRASALG